jgi:sRNA-binding protein
MLKSEFLTTLYRFTQLRYNLSNILESTRYISGCADDALIEAVEDLVSIGVTVVVAAGNSAMDAVSEMM